MGDKTSIGIYSKYIKVKVKESRGTADPSAALFISSVIPIPVLIPIPLLIPRSYSSGISFFL